MGLEPLYYSASYFNYNYQNEFAGPKENLLVWEKYFNHQFSLEEIDQLIYLINIQSPNFNPLFQNKLFNYLVENNNPEAADYIKFAKMVEIFLEYDYWEKKYINADKLEKSISIAQNRLKTIQEPEIKLRYAYQLIVIGKYLLDWELVNQTFETYFTNDTKNHPLYYWSLFYYSDQLNEIEKHKNWVQIFENTSAKAPFIILNFTRNKEKLDQIKSLLETPNELSTFYAIQSFKNPGKANREFNEVIKHNPSSPFIEILLIREINKFEDWNLTPIYSNEESSSIRFIWYNEDYEDKEKDLYFLQEKNYQKNKQYFKNFISVCENYLKKNKPKNQNLWFIALSYMHYLIDDKKTSEKYLEKTNHNLLSDKEWAQIKTIEILNFVKDENKWDEKFQNQLFEKIQQLEKYQDVMYDYERFVSQLMLALSFSLDKKNKIPLAGLFMTKIKGDVIHEFFLWYDHNYKIGQLSEGLNNHITALEA